MLAEIANRRTTTKCLLQSGGGGIPRTPTRPTGRRQNEDLGVGAVGGIDLGAIPKVDFDKVRRLGEGEGAKAGIYEECIEAIGGEQ